MLKFKIQKSKGKSTGQNSKAFKFLLLTCSFTFLLFTFAFSAAAERLTENVLKDGIGVRPLGMGGAFTAVADDGHAVFYNPAGLGYMNYQYIKGYLDINRKLWNADDYYIVAMPNFGVSGWRKYNLVGERVEVLCFSLGMKGEEGASWGVNYKIVKGDLGTPTEVGEGWGMDFGLRYPINRRLALGLLMQDLIEDGLNMPVSIRAGVSYLLTPKVLLAIDSEFRNVKAPQGPTIYMHYGVESKLTDGLMLRAGWGRGEWTGGITFIFSMLVLDYALSMDPVSGREAVQRYSLRFSGGL